jgi:hypothetical protein
VLKALGSSWAEPSASGARKATRGRSRRSAASEWRMVRGLDTGWNSDEASDKGWDGMVWDEAHRVGYDGFWIVDDL